MKSGQRTHTHAHPDTLNLSEDSEPCSLFSSQSAITHKLLLYSPPLFSGLQLIRQHERELKNIKFLQPNCTNDHEV